MTIEGGQAGRWADSASGVRNSRAALADQAGVLPHLGDKFELTGRHAEGATCEVFKAHHVALDIAVAVKVLRPEYVADARFLERMRIEAQVLPRLRSPHIVQCFDRGLTADGRPFTVLEFLRGETLEALLERFGKFDELVTIELGTALLDALSIAHARGIVHRDVSLRNLIVHRTEHDAPTLKLIDFGFAIVMPGAPESAPEPTEAPERDAAVGTPRFTSPEVATGRNDIDGRADLYSTGAILYTLLAGRDPFAALRTAEAVLEAHAHRSVPPLSLYAHGVSKELEGVVMRLVEKQRANRFSSAKQAAQELMKAGEVLRSRARSVHTVPPATSSRPALNVGDRCGPYVVTRLIDGGGRSEVYEVGTTEVARKRPLALKLMKRGLSSDAGVRAKVSDATRQLATLRHPNLPCVHQTGEHEGRPWFSMDLVAGVALRQNLRTDRPLPPAQAIKLAYGIAGALRQLHRLGTVHGNLTPGSVMVTPGGEARVIHATPTSTLDARSDIHAWGLLVFEMLIGRPAHPDASPPRGSPASLDALLRHLTDSIPNHVEVAPHLPKRLWELLEAATDKRPERPESFSAVLAALDGACEGIPLAHPLVETQHHAVALNGSVLVLLWRTPTSAGIREAREATRHSDFRAVLFVVDLGAATADTNARNELSELTEEIVQRATVAAFVYEAQAFCGTATHSASSSESTIPPRIPIGTFTSVGTAVDWLARYHPDLDGFSDLTGVVSDLRRRLHPAPSAVSTASLSCQGIARSNNRNLVTRIVGRVLLLCENGKAPTDEEWSECLELLTRLKRSERKPGVLVITDGGGPNAGQREMLKRALAGEPIPVAVVSDNLKARFISAAVALINRDQKGFSRNEIHRAHVHVGLAPGNAQHVEKAIAEMTLRLDRSRRV